MKLLNFSHPVTDENLQQLSDYTGQPFTREDVVTIPVQVNMEKLMLPQVHALVERALAAVPAGSEVIVNLPGLSIVSALLLSQLARNFHVGLMRLISQPDRISTKYIITEILWQDDPMQRRRLNIRPGTRYRMRNGGVAYMIGVTLTLDGVPAWVGNIEKRGISSWALNGESLHANRAEWDLMEAFGEAEAKTNEGNWWLSSIYIKANRIATMYGISEEGIETIVMMLRKELPFVTNGHVIAHLIGALSEKQDA